MGWGPERSEGIWLTTWEEYQNKANKSLNLGFAASKPHDTGQANSLWLHWFHHYFRQKWGRSHRGHFLSGHCLDVSVTSLSFQDSHKKCKNYTKVKTPQNCKGLLLIVFISIITWAVRLTGQLLPWPALSGHVTANRLLTLPGLSFLISKIWVINPGFTGHFKDQIR